MANKKKTSISDIARAMGVSVTTISFILNGKAQEKRISESLTRRVLDYVNKVGYKPSKLIRKSSTAPTKVLAFLGETTRNPFLVEVGEHVESIAAELGYQVLYFNTSNDGDKTDRLLQVCIEKEIDGVMIAPAEGLEEILQKMKAKIPMVLFDRFVPTLDISYVVSDNRRGAYEATRYLLENGHKRVGLVSLYSNQTHIRGRLDGYMDAMDEFRVQSFIRKLNEESSREEVQEQIDEFIADNKLEAVIFATQQLAVQGLYAVKRNGRSLSKGFTFDDQALFEYGEPAICVVKQDSEKLAQELVDTLIKTIGGKLQETRKAEVSCKLLLR